MRVCVIGNSHVASLKSGWDQLAARYRDVELTFFASRGNLIAQLELVGNVLVAPGKWLPGDLAHTSGGRDRIELDAYDVFLTYGIAPRMPRMDRSLSAAVRAQCCHDVWSGCTARRIGDLLRAGSDRQVFAGHMPQMAAPAGSRPDGRLSYDETFAYMEREVARDGCVLVRQPKETFADDWASRLELSRGSKRLDVGDAASNQPHPDDDVVHMNGDFGAAYLQHFFAVLDLN